MLDNYSAFVIFESWHNKAYHTRCEICGQDIMILPEEEAICEDCLEYMEDEI
jgi:hypothetical protein